MSNILLFMICLVMIWDLSTSEDTIAAFDVDKFINDYIKEVQRTLRLDTNEHSIKKRSHPDVDLYQLQGLELLAGFRELSSVPAKLPNDIVLFSHCGKDPQYEQLWFAAALEVNLALDSRQELLANNVVLYKYQEGFWNEADRKEVFAGVRLATEQIDDLTYIIVAENHTRSSSGSSVFQVNTVTNSLEFTHELPVHYPSDVIIWKWEDMDSFAAVAVSENPPGSPKRYETQSPVFLWQGSHFDEIDTLPTYNPRALTQFNVGSSKFIAVANFQNDLGDTSVDSEIFRLSVSQNQHKFSLYQKLPTQAAIDVKYFCFQSLQMTLQTESFLIFASAYHKDDGGNRDFDAPSIVYKMSLEEYFVPFQALRVKGVTSWLPVRYSKENQETLILIAASDEGITSYQYDGWRFVLTGAQAGRRDTAFGLGPKSLSVFYQGNQTIISAANKYSRGDQVNVFSLETRTSRKIGDMQKTLLSWQETMETQIARVEERVAVLMEKAQTAPSLNDKVINLGSNVIFHNAQIDFVETFRTNVGEGDLDIEVERQLHLLNEDLSKLERQLKQEIQTAIDEITFHTMTIHEGITQLSAEIQCIHCHVHQNLEVNQMNNENMVEFFDNIVNTKSSVVFDEEVAFDHIALQTPLRAAVINGHEAETLIDWSKEVTLDHGIEVIGNVTVMGDIKVDGTIDRVLVKAGKELDEEDITDEKGEAVMSSTNYFNTLSASQLFLSDGKLSGQSFEEFNQFTLKTKGDQVITEFMEFENIAVDELRNKNNLFVNSLPSHLDQLTPCEGKFCAEDMTLLQHDLHGEASESINDVTFIDWPEEEVLQDVTISGTIIIQDGSLIADDLVDTKHNVSSRKLIDYGIPLDTSVIDQPITFLAGFETPNLSIETLDGVAMDDLVDRESSDPVILKGRKVFRGSLSVNGTVVVRGNVNGVKQPSGVQGKTNVERLKAYSINSNNVEIDGVEWERLVTRREDGGVYLRNLVVEEDATANSVMLRGTINSHNLEQMLHDTVYKNGSTYSITGRKNFVNGIKIHNLTLKTLNDIPASTFYNPLSPRFDWRRRLSQAEDINVQNLIYTGYLDEIEARDFGRWLKTEGDQDMFGSQLIDHLDAEDLTVNMCNYVDLGRLATEGVFLTDNVTLSHVVFETVESSNINVGGKLNGLQLPADITLADSVDQLFTAEKHLLGSLVVHGRLHLGSNLSGINLTAYCQAISANSSNLNIQGNAKFKKEPTIYDSVNNNKWTDLMKVWFVDDHVNITTLLVQSTQFTDLSVVNINGDPVNKTLATLISLSQDQVINGTFYFKNIIANKYVIADDILIGGTVQDLELKSFVKSVLLNGEDQEISGIIDFSSLTVDGVLVNEGLVNSLNLSVDVMRTDVESNTVTSPMTFQYLSAEKLTLPAGTMLGGVDLNQWDRTTVKVHQTNTVLTGNLVFEGEVDIIGIRVDGRVNGLPFNKNHLMLVNSSQQVDGIKRFSNLSKLHINKLEVAGHFNTINVTDLYNQQVTSDGNVTLTGRNSFTSPLYSNRVQLPEMYQGHNLSRLEALLSSPLPWAQYRGQLELIDHTRQLADISLRAKAYYLKNFTRAGDIQGKVFFTFPLRTDSSSVVAAVREHKKMMKLSLLVWDSSHNMFLDMKGSSRYILRFPLEEAQSVTMPTGEMTIYATSYQFIASKKVGNGEILSVRGKEMNSESIELGKPGTSLLYFQDSSARTCYVIVKSRCLVVCITQGGQEKLKSFSCQNVTQATMLAAEGSVFMVGLQNSDTSSILLVWKFSGRSFSQVWAEPQFNPVSITATTNPRPLIAVANKHREGSSRPETIDIYRLNVGTRELVWEQSLPSISPKKVLFATLPTRESVMYIASDNPATPLEVFIYRGLLGYRWLMVEPTLPTPLDIYAFTDHHHQHFVLINSSPKGCVLQAQFQGEFVDDS